MFAVDFAGKEIKQLSLLPHAKCRCWVSVKRWMLPSPGPWACFSRRSREEVFMRTEQTARMAPGRMLRKGRSRQEWTTVEMARYQQGSRENHFNQEATESYEKELEDKGKDNTKQGLEFFSKPVYIFLSQSLVFLCS